MRPPLPEHASPDDRIPTATGHPPRCAATARRTARPSARPWRLALALAALLLVGACATIPRARTLPPTVRSVYVPMFTNHTHVPGLEEKATRATQREFLADGRLRLEQKRRADAWIECAIREFSSHPRSYEADDFPSFQRLRIVVDVKVRENLPTTPLLGGTRQVTAQFLHPADLRRSIAMLDVEALDRLMEDLGRLVVREVLTGEYGEETFVTDRPSPPPVE